MGSRMKFGEILIQAGVITKTELNAALSAQIKNGMALGRILEDEGLISDQDIVDILARQFNLPVIDAIEELSVSETVLELIDCDQALRMMVFPRQICNNGLEVAISNPLDFNTLNSLEFKTGRNIHPVLATPTTIFKAIQRFYLQESPAETSPGTCLLIIDDQDLYRSTICSNFKQKGYLPLFAVTVEEAIHVARQTAPRLILVDTCLKAVSSQMIFERLRQNDCTGNCPIIALTANTTADEEAFLLRLGFFDVITKPLIYTRLQARIERALHFYYHGAVSPYAHPFHNDEARAHVG
jgi:CheY-like chemotaxis protein